MEVFAHRLRHHFSHTWLDRGGAEGDRTSVQMLRRYGASPRSARARRSYDRSMADAPLPESAGGPSLQHPTKTKYPPFGAVCGEWALIRVGAQIGLIWFNRFLRCLSGPTVAC